MSQLIAKRNHDFLISMEAIACSSTNSKIQAQSIIKISSKQDMNNTENMIHSEADFSPDSVKPT
jgi:hypothetical protein